MGEAAFESTGVSATGLHAESLVLSSYCMQGLGRVEEAVELLAAALRGRRSEGLPLSNVDGRLAYALGEAQWRLERAEDARESFEDSIAAYSIARSAQHPGAVPARTGVIRVALSQSDFETALQQVAKIHEHSLEGLPPAERAAIQFMEARALWESSRDRSRGMALARYSAQVLRESPGQHRDLLSHVQRWIDERA
jgi:tetratricopeptide (TPR) repeat protein